MTGNENTWEASVQQLVPPIVASRVRVLPRSRHPRTVFKQHNNNNYNDLPRYFYHHSSKYPFKVCMRLELHGCSRSSLLPMSYKAPPGEAFSPRLPLRLVVCSEYVNYMFLRYHRISLMTGISMTGHWVFWAMELWADQLTSPPHLGAGGWAGPGGRWLECKKSFRHLNPSKAPLLISFEFAAAQTLLGVLIVVYNKPELSVQVMIKVMIKVMINWSKIIFCFSMMATRWKQNSGWRFYRQCFT